MLFKKYVFKSISQMFFPFFFVLFFVTSVILILNIAFLTNGVKLTFLDLAKLYYYGIPNNIFFVIALTFYSACIMGLSRLSYDSEMLVFFSLNYSPSDIIKALLPLCALVSFVLLMFSLVVAPTHKNAYRNFISFKTSEIDINIKPGDYGQRIGEWLVYVDSKISSNEYAGLVLYSDSMKQDATESAQSVNNNFIIAKRGVIENKKDAIELKLFNGEAYLYDKGALQKVKFNTMIVRNALDTSTFEVQELYAYWASAFHGDFKQLRRLSQALCTSFFPLASIFFILFFGIKNPRFHKNYAYFYVLGSGGAYLTLMYILSMDYPLLTLLLPLAWLVCGYYCYRRWVRRFY